MPALVGAHRRIATLLDAEIDALNVGIVGHRPGRAFEDGAADLQDIGVIGRFQRQVDRLLGKQDGLAVFVQGSKEIGRAHV